MPWQSGNDGGNDNEDGGKRNPWGQRPKGSGGGNQGGPGNGPNLDDLLRQGQERFRKGIPGGFGGGFGGGNNGARMIPYIFGGLIALWVVSSSFYRVNEGEIAVIQQFGAFMGQTGPGLQFKLPDPIQTVKKVKVETVNEIEIGSAGGSGGVENLVLTGDQNIVDVAYTVRWKIKNAEQYLFQLEQPEETVREVAESAMREAIALTNINDAIGSGRAVVANRVQKRTQAVLDQYKSGILINGIFIKQVSPPQKVVSAFRDITAAKSDAFAFKNKADAYRQKLINGAQGDASRFNAAYEQYKLAPEVTRKRLYLETMEQVLDGTNKIIVESKGVVPFLPLNQLQPVPSVTVRPTDAAQTR
jgi:modulator of FtsH protease HflK